MSGRDEMLHAHAGGKLTYDDFLLFPDDGMRHELINGVHYVTPSPNIGHQRILGNLHYLLRVYLAQYPRGQVFMAPLDVIFSNIDIVEPDLLYVSNERAAQVLTADWVRGVPELVIEIASPSTRKRDDTIKRRLYERMGVSEYWIVEPSANAVRVYRRGDGDLFGPAVVRAAAADDELTTPLLPGLSLPLAKIFKE